MDPMGRFARRSAWLALLAGLLTACDPVVIEETRRRIEGGGDTPEALAAIAARVEAVVSRIGSEGLEAGIAGGELGPPGLSVAVVDQGRVEWVEYYGNFSAIDPREIGPYTLFQGASISKPITAVLALQLVEEGLLELDGDVEEVLQSWSIPENDFTATDPVTPRRIMSHTAGFNVSGFFGYPPGAPVPSLAQILRGELPAQSAAIQLVSRPGAVWSYSGGGVTVLQQIIEDVGGEPFRERAVRRVLEPAGMWTSHFEHPLPPVYEYRAALGTPTGSNAYPELGAAGLWSHPLDLAYFVVAVQRALAGEDDSLLGRDTARLMVERQRPGPGFFATGFPDGGMGLGFFIRGTPTPRWFWHTGGNWGFESVLVGSIEGGRGAVVMANGFRGRNVGWDVIEAVADVYGWEDW